MRKAKSPSERGFDRYDQRRLARALHRVAEVHTYRRIQAVLLVAQGRTVLEAAQITGVQAWNIYGWVRTCVQTHRPDSISDAPWSGRPRVAGTITEARLVREFRQDSMRLGYNATGWTVTLLADQGATEACRAPPGGRSGAVAALRGARLVQLPRRARQPPLSRPVPHPSGSALAARLATPQPEVRSLDVGPDGTSDRPVATPTPDPASVPESAADDRPMTRGKSRMR